MVGYFESIYADTELPHRCKTVYIYLRDRANASGTCWPGIKTIASDLGLSRSTVKRAINELERKGFLLKNPRYRANGSHTSNLLCAKAKKWFVPYSDTNHFLLNNLPPRGLYALTMDRGWVHYGPPRRSHSIGELNTENSLYLCLRMTSFFSKSKSNA